MQTSLPLESSCSRITKMGSIDPFCHSSSHTHYLFGPLHIKLHSTDTHIQHTHAHSDTCAHTPPHTYMHSHAHPCVRAHRNTHSHPFLLLSYLSRVSLSNKLTALIFFLSCLLNLSPGMKNHDGNGFYMVCSLLFRQCLDSSKCSPKIY